jgi:integrase
MPWMAYFSPYPSQLVGFSGTAAGVQQKMMRYADVTTTMNVYGKAMMDSELEAHTKLPE